jgi:threonylcarbamoyladenosine tRNA methylthiotransferase MtaB
MRTFTITTLGCKVNQYESDTMAQYLINSGWAVKDNTEIADVCIINTCAVTQKASMQSRQAVRQTIRNHPDARIIVTGCYAQINPDEIMQIQGVHDIIGHPDKHRIPEIILTTHHADRTCPVVICGEPFREHDFKQIPTTPLGRRTRAFLKIQDGCNTLCSYCIVPYARGRSRSLSPGQALEHIRRFQQAGYREVVLTGVHLGAYGWDLTPPTNLFALLNRIQESSTIDRVRLSSIEPLELNDDIIKLVAESDRFCHHFHIPLQSGDDQILKQMNRPYTRSFFMEQVTKIHELIPDAAIGVDTLIGFPGETEAAFKNTYAAIAELPITYLHVFPFSSRAGTAASRYPQKVPALITKTRCTEMRNLGNAKKARFYQKFLGRKVEVLFESRRNLPTGLLKGLTSNYVPVLAAGGHDLENTLVQVRIDRLANNHAVIGIVCNKGGLYD